MTLLVSWFAKDNHGVTSAYIMSESRLSLIENNNTKKHFYDSCRKVFASEKYPDIIGYCGDVLFPSLVINQLLQIIDKGLLFKDSDNAKKRYKIFKDKLISEFLVYPQEIIYPIELIYINKELSNSSYPSFYCHNLKLNSHQIISEDHIEFPLISKTLYIYGSGTNEFKKEYALHQDRKNKNTSRNIFHSFIKTLSITQEPTCGGPPQLVGLYRKPKTNGKVFGIIYKKAHYILGTRITRGKDFNVIEWRNENFERTDGNTRRRIKKAKKQPID